MPVKLLTASSGSVTLDAANTASNFVLTIPAVTATMLNNQSDITAQVKTATSASGDAPIYSCRAWVNFNGEGTVAIRASGNVSSITDNGTGQYTVNFTTAMPDTNYAATGGGGGGIRNNTLTNIAFPDNLRATGSIGIDTQYAHLTAYDPPFVAVAIFR